VLIKIFQDKRDLARAVAEEAASDARQSIQQQGRVRIIAATQASIGSESNCFTSMNRWGCQLRIPQVSAAFSRIG
jgi:hypothetical protein